MIKDLKNSNENFKNNNKKLKDEKDDLNEKNKIHKIALSKKRRYH